MVLSRFVCCKHLHKEGDVSNKCIGKTHSYVILDALLCARKHVIAVFKTTKSTHYEASLYGVTTKRDHTT